MRSEKGPMSRGPGRRRWSRERKRQIMAEARAPGASVAQRHELNANLLFKWLRAAGHGRPARPACASAEGAAEFVSLGVLSRDAGTGAAMLRLPAPSEAVARTNPLEQVAASGMIEIDLPGGARVRVDGQAINGRCAACCR